jgi:hypothetical protein
MACQPKVPYINVPAKPIKSRWASCIISTGSNIASNKRQLYVAAQSRQPKADSPLYHLARICTRGRLYNPMLPTIQKLVYLDVGRKEQCTLAEARTQRLSMTTMVHQCISQSMLD